MSSGKSFIAESEGVRYAGTHLLIELSGAKNLTDAAAIERCLRDCVDAVGSTLLHVHSHAFTDSGGITAVAALSESHMSIHTWPEVEYAAVDIFLCGDKQPQPVVEVLRRYFEPINVQTAEHRRGVGCF